MEKEIGLVLEKLTALANAAGTEVKQFFPYCVKSTQFRAIGVAFSLLLISLIITVVVRRSALSMDKDDKGVLYFFYYIGLCVFIIVLGCYCIPNIIAPEFSAAKDILYLLRH